MISLRTSVKPWRESESACLRPPRRRRSGRRALTGAARHLRRPGLCVQNVAGPRGEPRLQQSPDPGSIVSQRIKAARLQLQLAPHLCTKFAS